MPTLAVTGSKDLQVKPADLAAVADTARGPVEFHEIPDVTHILRHQPGPASLGPYKKELKQPVAPGMVALVVDWTRRAVGVPVA